ncbi:uncharacterized protein FIBRA_00968 [Fibroporia radiculosa]|uniref:Ras-GAP domain-containing protein n=1 Tax=Fibroporia radiculosa TaxID=599839 RepID=J4GJ15_9APHY|nr:uncharacterized protein FIBRA_00968 [Fibroporia radiculosa]CCL98960.1 predicted protein [Fibroporia radiculosa]
MSRSTDHSRTKLHSKSTSSPDKHFHVPIDLYLSPREAAAIRKPAVLYKRSQDRLDKPPDPARSTRGPADSASRKVKEKASWLSLGRNSTSAGLWKPATCTLVEEEEGCLLNVFIETPYFTNRSMSISLITQIFALYITLFLTAQTVWESTALRAFHFPVFSPPNLANPLASGQTWCSFPLVEPLFVHFPDNATLHAWLALLRSYAQPEAYGRWLAPTDGGLYRMWRQVELTCLQGRNLGASRPLSGVFSDDTSAPNVGFGVGASGDPDKERPIDPGGGGGGVSSSVSASGSASSGIASPDALDIDVYAEVFVNGSLCGRTTVKRGVGAPDWQERFVFADLPPFETLEVVLWREKRLARPAVLGSVIIVLPNFRRGESIEGWFPVLAGVGPGGGVDAAYMQAGEMRLRVRVDEEIILPFSEYAAVLDTFTSRNSLDWMRDLEVKFRLKSIAHHIISIAIAKDMLVDNIMELADREVDGTPTSHNTLFRGNTVLTKTMEMYMSWYGSAFLEASIGATVRRLCAERVAIEVDPVRSGKGSKNAEKNVELLVYWCQEFWGGIYDARKLCPPEMRRLFQHVRRLVEKRYCVNANQNMELPRQSVSAFCFLRFIVPAILHPHLFGLWPGMPEVRVQRSLTLIAKVIQNLANLNAVVRKEQFMRGVKDFLTSSLQGMVDYIAVISTPEPEHTRASASSTLDKNEELRILGMLRQRGLAAPVLHREATPIPPHLLDLSKHLAVLTSVVVRHSRSHNYVPSQPSSSAPASDSEQQFDSFCRRCLEVEEQALRRVSQLASRPGRRRDSSVSTSSPLAMSVPLPPSPTSPIQIPRRGRRISVLHGNRSTRRLPRPRTAPHEQDASGSQNTEASDDASVPQSPTVGTDYSGPTISQSAPDISAPVQSTRDQTRSLRSPRPSLTHHPRSSSTDSALMSRGMRERLSLVSSGTRKALSDLPDDTTRKRKGIFRGILGRR